jgi:hypothetical protein
MKTDLKTKLAAVSMNILPQVLALGLIFTGAWLKFSAPVAFITLGGLVWLDLWLDAVLERTEK